MSIKVVYNACYGGFSLSEAACQKYKDLTGTELENDGRYIVRHDPVLVQIVEELGKEASGDFANLKIASLGQETKYRIDEYDGNEWVETPNSIEWVQP